MEKKKKKGESRKKEGEKRGVLYIFNVFSLYPVLWLIDAVTHGSASIHQPPSAWLVSLPLIFAVSEAL